MKRTPLQRKTSLTRKARLRQRSLRESAKRRRERQFGPQAALCRVSPCLICDRTPCDPHHEPPRSLGGLDEDTVPLCREHHEDRERWGKARFELHYGVSLLSAAEYMRKRVEERGAAA